MQTQTPRVTLLRYTTPPHAFQHSNHWRLPTRWEHTGRQKAGAWTWSTRPCKHPRWMPHTTHTICRLHSTPSWDGREHCASLCTRSIGRHRSCTKRGPYVFQHRQEIQQHERVFLMWIQCGRWPHVPDLSPSVETFQSSRSIRSEHAQQYIDAGYDACTKAKHKTQLPNF